ncbi:hypothetical protein I4F81_010098 [Pyropia yezoensis]|uniref:Uncharacterized protein n=1 Tax=Pyropia yezoensis TaxID=2788 RepID=A0ACC3CBP1_PYRYE|nr:hypothetical protein I4F81_010098 [Neopyropia yezoensis]
MPPKPQRATRSVTAERQLALAIEAAKRLTAAQPRRRPPPRPRSPRTGVSLPGRRTAANPSTGPPPATTRTRTTSFDIPRSVLREDGLPMPFTPSDPVHTATFNVGSRDEIEARHWYCVLAWLQQVFNDCLDARFARGNTVAHLEELLDYLVGATRRVFALGVSRYDYLALRQSEPSLADAFAHSDAVPRNSLRGDGARRFISRVVRAETTASAKIGAAERGYSYPNRGGFCAWSPDPWRLATIARLPR